MVSLDAKDFLLLLLEKFDYIHKKLAKLRSTLNFKSNLEICLKYLLSFPWIDYYVIGVNNYKQLKQISIFLDQNSIYKLPDYKIRFIQSKFKKIPLSLILPYKWK